MSEKSLDKLIDSIKSEAIESARKESHRILEEANSNAKKIIDAAENQKRQLLEDAQKEAEAIVKNGESALRQAARDLNITVHLELMNLLKSVLDHRVEKEFTPGLVGSAILKVVENIGEPITLKLSEDFKKELADFIHEELKSSPQLISVEHDTHVLRGLSISNSKEGWSYEVTPSEIASVLHDQLTDNWLQIIQNAERS